MKESLSLKENVTAMLAYVFGWVSGLVVLLLEKDNLFVRYHAMQSIVIFGSLSILGAFFSTMPFLHGFLLSILNLLLIGLWILLMVKAYQHETIKMPIVTELVSSLLKKMP